MNTFDFDLDIDTKEVGEKGEFEGYASVFGNVDQGGDIVLPGAFMEGVSKAKKENRVIPMLWQHDQREPIGVWSDIVEDAKGLRVKGRLLVESDSLAKRAHSLLKEKALGGMSIGYRIPMGGAQPDEKRAGIRKLVKIDLREISLVTMPMNVEARITSVKTILDAGKLPTVREFEEFLRDAGFSKSLATALSGKAAPLLRGEPEAKAIDEAEFWRAVAAG